MSPSCSAGPFCLLKPIWSPGEACHAFGGTERHIAMSTSLGIALPSEALRLAQSRMAGGVLLKMPRSKVKKGKTNSAGTRKKIGGLICQDCFFALQAAIGQAMSSQKPACI